VGHEPEERALRHIDQSVPERWIRPRYPHPMTRKTSPADRTCWWCGDELDERWRSDRLYCTEQHKEAAQRTRRQIRKLIEDAQPHDRKMRWLLDHPTDPAWQGLFRELWKKNAPAREAAEAAWMEREMEKMRKGMEEHRRKESRNGGKQ
jgi:hypothetical protein